jgi:hypothetical protein
MNAGIVGVCSESRMVRPVKDRNTSSSEGRLMLTLVIGTPRVPNSRGT